MRTAPIVCPEESPCFFADYGPKGCRGERREAGIQWIQPPKAVSDPEFRQTTSGAHGSAGRADCLPRGKPSACIMGNNFAVRNSPWRGLTRRLRRGRRACSPMGRSHFSFGGERKVCKRKPAARRLREKALYCPFLKEGVRNVARSIVERPTSTFVRARAHSFPLSKRARLFPSAAYRRSAPPQSAVGRLTPCGLGCFGVSYIFLQRKRPAGFQIHAGLVKRTMRPVAECRSVLCNWQGAIPDPRAARPVAERR